MAEDYQVTMSYDNETNVTLESETNTQVSTSYVVAESLEDLGNVDTSALDKTGSTTNNYVMVYDAAAQKYKFVNPDAILSAASDPSQTIQPGLPQDFIDAVTDEVEDDIHLDAGTF